MPMMIRDVIPQGLEVRVQLDVIIRFGMSQRTAGIKQLLQCMMS
jgi:hypothetical protein